MTVLSLRSIVSYRDKFADDSVLTTDLHGFTRIFFATQSQHQENQSHQWLKINCDARRAIRFSIFEPQI